MARLLPLLVVILAIISGAFFYHRYTVRSYEAQVDARIEATLNEANLNFLREQPLGGYADRPSLIRAFLTSQAGEPTNLRVAVMQAAWGRAYPRIARRRWPRDPRDANAVLAAEVDDRFGAGSFTAMVEEAARYRREAPAREAARAEQRRLEYEWMDRYVRDYYRRTGRYPNTVPPRPTP